METEDFTDTGGGQVDRLTAVKEVPRLDELAPRKVETVSHQPRRDLFYWPLGGALLLTLLHHGIAAVGSGVAGGRFAKASVEASST
jgi:hypothetical protein